jgi:hypothetical protein
MADLQKMIQAVLPPQPQPAQFQYTPGAPTDTATPAAQQPTIMQQVLATTTQQNPQGTQPNVQPNS